MAQLVSSIYRHTQSEASTLWTVVHNLGGAGGQGIPVVEVVVDVNGVLTKMMPAGINIVDKNTVTISFSTARAGTAIVIA